MDKFILKSRTIWGIILTALPAIIGVARGFGLDIPVEIVGEMDAAMKATFAAGEAAVGLFGIWLGVYGRFKAVLGITVKPKK